MSNLSTRRRLVEIFGLCLLILVCFVGPSIFAQPTDLDQPPNILFIAIDDLKPAIGAFGDVNAVTPNLDQLAARSTTFLNAHCQQAVCAPSRVSLLTGLRPDTTRVWDLKTRFRDHLPGVVTLPQRFKQAGYRSVGIGKVFDPRSTDNATDLDAASWSEPYLHVTAPADETYGYRNPAVVAFIRQRLAEIEPLPDPWVDQLNAIFSPAGRPPTDRAEVPDDAYDDGAVTEVALTRLADFAESGKPFFFAVGYKKPHLPFNAPEKYWAMHDPAAMPLAGVSPPPRGAPDYAPQPGWELRSAYAVPNNDPIPDDLQRELVHGYYAATSYIDAQVGRLVGALDTHGLADQTIIVVLGDHGWHLGDHGIWCKHTNYEQATRSPLIIYAPGSDQHPGTVKSPVELVDIYPTLLDLTGLDPAQPGRDELQGVSLKPLLRDPRGSVKSAAISQFHRQTDRGTLEGYAFRTVRHRYIEWRAMDLRAGDPLGEVVARELYDYETDPLETQNLIDVPGYAQALQNLENLADQYFRTFQHSGE